jgi:hypothetical protein
LASEIETAILEMPDIVIASSEQEKERLADLTSRTVLTLAPALPATACIQPIAREEPSLPLRVGVIAPALAEHLPDFLDFLGKLLISAFRTMSPLSVAVHDSAGRAFPIDHPELIGVTTVFEIIDSFYEAVDLLIVPSGQYVLGGADAGLGISAALPVIAVGSQND